MLLTPVAPAVEQNAPAFTQLLEGAAAVVGAAVVGAAVVGLGSTVGMEVVVWPRK